MASAKDDSGRRIVFAMTGMKSVNERATQARALMTLGLRGFENVVILKGDETAGEVPVTGGIAKSVPVRAAGEVRFIEPRGSGSPYQTEIVPVGTIEAPVAEGRRVAQMKIMRDGQVVREEPLYAAGNVERAGILQRVQEQVMGYFQ